MSYIIAIKNPDNDKIFAIENEYVSVNDVSFCYIKTFDTLEEAERDAADRFICKYWPYEIVEIDL